MKKREIPVIMILTLLFLPALTSAQTQQTADLSNILINKSATQLEVKLEIGTAVNYESFTLFNPNRLILDLLQVESFSCAPEIPVNDFGIIRIRTAKNQPDVTRVVFDMEESIPAYSIEEKDSHIFIYFKREAPVEEREVEPAPVEKPPVKVEEKVETEPVKKTPVKKRVAAPRPEVRPQRIEEAEPVTRGKALTIGATAGFYFVQNADFQEVYGKSAFSFGGELSFLLPLSNKEDIGFALNFCSISATGEATFTGEEVKLNITPVSLSVFYQRQFGKFTPFAGIGGDSFSYKETLPETFAVSEVSGSMQGYHLLLGTNFSFTDFLSAKIYFRTHIAKKTEEEMEINLSGNAYGIGLTYHFNF